MAFSSIAALVGGTAASATLVLGAIAEVGMAMTVVGAVTGSKSLMKLGGAMSLVGGIGGMINGAVSGGVSSAATAGVDSAAGTVAESAAGGSSFGALDGATSSLTDSMTAFESGDWGGVIGEAQEAALGGLSGASTVNPMADATVEAAGSAGVTPNQAVYEGINQAPDPTKAQAGQMQQIINEPTYNPAKDSQAANVAIDAKDGAGSALKSYTSEFSSKNWFEQFFDWAKKNEKLATAGATLISGGFQGMGQMKLAEMQSEQNKMRYQYGNEVASFRPRQMPLIGRTA